MVFTTAATTRKHKKVKAYRKSIQKEPTVKRYLLILALSQTKAFYRQRIPEFSCARKEYIYIRNDKKLELNDLQLFQI